MFSASGSPLSSLQQRHPPLRVHLQVLLGALLALGEVHAPGLVLLAALLQHDMRGHRARAGAVIQRQHDNTLSDDDENKSGAIKRGSTRQVKHVGTESSALRLRRRISSTMMLLSRSASPARTQASSTSQCTLQHRQRLPELFALVEHHVHVLERLLDAALRREIARQHLSRPWSPSPGNTTPRPSPPRGTPWDRAPCARRRSAPPPAPCGSARGSD